MAERTYDAGALVQLPKFNAAGGIALGTQIITVAGEAGALPAMIKKSVGRLEARHKALHSVSVGRLLDPANPDSEVAKQADRNIDAAWSATLDWGSGWAKLPLPFNEEKAGKARTLLSVLYVDGLKFTQLVYKLEWAESQIRLDRIERDGLDEVFTELGGADFLKTLRTAHKAYGVALGLTKTKETAESIAELRGPLDAFCEALRLYVVAVTAHADPDEPMAVALSEKLLAPLKEWQTSAAAPKAKAGEVPAPEDDPVT